MDNSLFQDLVERDASRQKVDKKFKYRLAAKVMGWSAPRAPWISVRTVGAFAVVALFVLVLVQPSAPKTPTFLKMGMPAIDDWQGTDEPTRDDLSMKSAKQAGISNTPTSLMQGLSSVAQSIVGNVAPSGGSPTIASAPMARSMDMNAEATLGYSVGGAKDVGSFRENILNGYTPPSTDLTYEGLFYDYFFDTGSQQPCSQLFCPSYARAVSRDPLTGENAYYLSVGLNSNIKQSDFQRAKANIVIVLDISGSMGSPFDRYYYDTTGKQVEIPSEDAGKTKMELASQAVNAIIDQLEPDDRLGIVLFSDDARVAKPLNLMRTVDRDALKRHVLALQATNGTNMSSGLQKGAELLRDEAQSGDGYANRLIFITDAMPNEGEFGAGGLEGLVQRTEDAHIDTSFVGVGVDFQSQLVEALTKVRGANYLSVHSAQEFKERLGEQFAYLITPLVYDLRLNLAGSGFAIDKVYGSPDVDLSTGEVLHVRTLFPSTTKDGQTRGGLVLLKLKKIGDNPTMTLYTTYQDTHGETHRTEATASFADMVADTYDNLGIRKGVLLARYAELIKNWLKHENGTRAEQSSWEQTSLPLHVSSNDQALFSKFADFFRQEATQIGDTALDQEQQILDRLAHLTSTGVRIDDDWNP